MNKTLSTTLIVIAVLALAGGIFFAGSMYARANAFGPSMMYGWNNKDAYGPNMMNGSGPSMMGGNGGNMMNGYNNTNVTPLTIDQAKTAAEKYLSNLNNSDLQIAEVMIFDNNAYVVVKEISTGKGAFELLVDSASQITYPEYGPNMMWNLKYGGLNHEYMMSNNAGMMAMIGGNNGMMNGWDSAIPLDVAAEMTVTPEQAVQFAQQYLDTNDAGAIAASDPMQFYGYYTLDFEKDGQIVGMLSVNGYNGQIFLHTWHGTFIKETE